MQLILKRVLIIVLLLCVCFSTEWFIIQELRIQQTNTPIILCTNNKTLSQLNNYVQSVLIWRNIYDEKYLVRWNFSVFIILTVSLTSLCLYLAVQLEPKISFHCIHFAIYLSEYDAITIKAVDTNAKPILKEKVFNVDHEFDVK